MAGPTGWTEDEAQAPFIIQRPSVAALPAVFASPHSGALYPRDMRPARGLDLMALRRSEDVLVDRLIAPAPALGFTTLAATVGRAYLDLNRAADEIDAEMIADGAQGFARRRTAKVAAGLGVAPRLCADGREIYDRPLTSEEMAARLERVHLPYHQALESLIAEARQRGGGGALLVDWHSMPSAAAGETPGGEPVDLVLGDRYGQACGPQVIAWLEALFAEAGFTVSRNTPYAGGHTVEAHGRPRAGVHAIQVEINRRLYLDEETLRPSGAFPAFAAGLEGVFRRMAGADWAALLQRA